MSMRTLPHDRDAVRVGKSGRKPQFTQRYLCSCGGGGGREQAQLGQGAIDVPMMETGQDVAPSEEAEREHLRTLLANLDASIVLARTCARFFRPSRRSASGSRLISRPSDRSRPGSERPTRLTRRQTRSTRRWLRRRSPSWLCSWPSRG